MTELEVCCEILRRERSPVVLELGAHHGSETVRLYDACCERKGGPLAYVAVEADPRNGTVLRRAIGPRSVTILEAAVAAETGSVKFWPCIGNSNASGSIRRPKEHLVHFPQIGFEQPVEIPAFSLDDIAARYGLEYVTLIWSDVQGAERDMIAGGRETLAKTRYLLCECDRVEMYEGQALPPELVAMLPGWELIQEWRDNANMLFRNTRCL